MRRTPSGRMARSVMAVLSSVVITGALTELPASADTASSTAQAVNIQSLGVSVLAPAASAASPSNPSSYGTTGPVGASTNLGSPLLSSGVLAQAATFDTTAGGNAACAGILGPGGSITIGSDGSCTVSGVTSGVTLTLDPSDVITANAILETCQTTASGQTAALQLANAKLNGVALNTSYPANSTILAAGSLATILANQQSTSGGTITATALKGTVGSVLGTTVTSETIGSVTCGPVTQVAPTSVLPVKSLPIAAATLAALAAIGVTLQRRLRARRSAA